MLSNTLVLVTFLLLMVPCLKRQASGRSRYRNVYTKLCAQSLNNTLINFYMSSSLGALFILGYAWTSFYSQALQRLRNSLNI